MNTRESARVTKHSLLSMSLYTEIIINAAPTDIWKVLTDFSSYCDWNPSIPYAQGEARAGDTLHVEIKWPGLSRNTYALEVLCAHAERKIRWQGRFGLKGLLDGNHSFEIEPLGEGCCKVIQTEYFRGWLVPVFSRWLSRNVLTGFVKINDSLKARVELGMKD